MNGLINQWSFYFIAAVVESWEVQFFLIRINRRQIRRPW
jgi:hypothetical protein